METTTPHTDQFTPPKTRVHRRAWVTYQLTVQNYTIVRLARQLGKVRQAVSLALSGGRSEEIERAIAAAIKFPVEQVYPEYYDEAGNRLHRRGKASRPRVRRLVEKAGRN